MLIPKPPRPQPFPPKPLPGRLPERKRMTIALGILAPDGVVIAADTQESWGYFGGAKIRGHKIHSRIVQGQYRSFAATGAGSAGYLESLNQELDDNFVDVQDPLNIERRFKEKIRKFFAAYVVPMQLPVESQPTVVLGASWKGIAPRLWANEQTALFRCKHFIAVGAGRAHASMLLNHLLPEKTTTTTELAAYVAALVIYQVKDYVEGCGMGTHITILKDGNAQYVSEAVVGELEHHFEGQLKSADEDWSKSQKPLDLIANGLVQIAGEAITRLSLPRMQD